MFKKILSFILIVSTIMCLCVFNVNAAFIDSAVINTATGTATVKGNVKDTSEYVSAISNGDFENGEINDWIGISSTKTNNGVVSVVASGDEQNKTKFLKYSERKDKYSMVGFDLTNFFLEHGTGTYKFKGKFKISYPDGANKSDTTKFAPLAAGLVLLRTQTTSKEVSGIEKTAFKTLLSTSKPTAETWYEFNTELKIDDFTFGNGNTYTQPSGSYLGIRADDQNYDICVDDVSVEFVKEGTAVAGSENLSVSLKDKSGNVKYTGNGTTDENGNYEITFNAGSDENLVFDVKSEATNISRQKDAEYITQAAGLEIKSNGTTADIKYNVKEVLSKCDGDNYKAIALVYSKDKKLLDVAISEDFLNNTTDVVQSMKVNISSSQKAYVNLYATNTKDKFIKIYSEDIELSEAKLVLIGDSICVNYPLNHSYPIQGWGYYMKDFLDEKMTVVNNAHGGYSTKTFLEGKGNWKGICDTLKAGDYVMVSLGINDSSSNEQYHTDNDKYIENLKKFASDTRSKGAEIIFITPTPGSWSENNSMAGRSGLMKQAAEEANVLCLDLNDKLYKIFKEIGNLDDVRYKYFIPNNYLKDKGMTDEQIKAASGNIKTYGYDYTHFNPDGAKLLATHIFELLAETDCGLNAYVK